ncbi:uncharacterized protein LOC132611917 [Lycium barbarum]|uniref:uncharacterized protein LOC132611917 n=1 Tax=Lycium barbarum TaxID=112863 RepID=UPI00293F749B|nr:uncharacterized protein LOC132611917 [Lycium barbarum]
MPVKIKATAAQKGKTMARRRNNRDPNVDEGETHHEAPSYISHTPPVVEEQEGASTPAPVSPVPPLGASGQQMTEEQQAAIVELQKKNNGTRIAGPNQINEPAHGGDRETNNCNGSCSNGSGSNRSGSIGSGSNGSSEVREMLEALAKQIDTNKKKVENYNSRVDQIPGAPPIISGLDSKRYIRRPFPPSVAPKLIPKRFTMSDIPKYDGTTDLQEHVTSDTCATNGNDLEEDKVESMLLKKFDEMLSKGAMTWYSMLPEHSINSFEMLADAFVKAHVGARKIQVRKADIFRIAQKDNELLREFVTRFQKQRMLLPPVPDRWVAQAFTKGLNSCSSVASFKLKENFLEYKAVTGADVHNRRNHRSSVSRALQFKNNPVGTSDTEESPRLSEYHFNVDAAAIVSAIGHIKDAKWPRPLRTDPVQRDPNAVYDYHATHGHRTEDCRQLRDEIARLLKNGYLHEFLSDRAKGHYKNREANKKVESAEPLHVINMIIGGVEIPQGPTMKKTKVSITREKRTRDYAQEGFIFFSDEDAEGIIQPHNDALVISILINKSQVKHILIDPGNLANIIR